MLELHPTAPLYPNLRELLFDACDRFETNTAMLEKKQGFYQQISFGKLGEQAEALATVLSPVLPEGARVLIVGKPCVGFALSLLATVCCGGVAVPVDGSVAGERVVALARRTGACLVLFDEASRELVAPLGTLPSYSFASFEELIAEGRALGAAGTLVFEERLIAPHSPALTFVAGEGEGLVTLSHQALVVAADAVCHAEHLNHSDVFLSVLPYTDVNEIVIGLLAPLQVGGSVAYAEGFSTLMRNMREVHPTAMVVTPGLATRIHDKFYALVEKNNTETTVRRVIATTDPVRPFSARQALKERLLDEARMPFGGVLRRLFVVGGILPAAKAKGLRQVGMFVAQTYGHVLVAGPVAMTAPHAYRDGTAGKLLPHVRVELVTVDADGRGRLLLGTSDALVEGGSFALENGLAVTGDVVLLSDDGYLSVLGREENLISRASGQVVCPEELETMLRQSPLVLEVAVVGVPTEDGGDTEPTAMILPDLAAAEEMLGESFETSLLEETLSEWITELNAPLMAEWRVAQFALADAPLPRDARGRICRRTVAEQLKQGLSAE